MSRISLGVARSIMFVVCLGVGSRAEAQWYFAGYLGANTTRPADVSLEVPAANLSMTFKEVEFEAHPFESPQYYGWRLGRLTGDSRRFGVEVEFIHLKVISRTGERYSATGTNGSAPYTVGDPMSRIAERYSMTHGLNFLVGNLVYRQPLGRGRAALVVRGGAGGTIPHTETTVLGGAVDKYEYGGMGLHAAAGLDVQLRGRLSLVAEYKWTRARPEITVAGGGTGRTTSMSHHVAGGLAFGLSR